MCTQSTTNKSALAWCCKHALLNLLRTRGHYNRDIRKIGFRYFGFLTRPQGETNIVYFQLRSLTQFFYKGHFSLLSHPVCKSRDSYRAFCARSVSYFSSTLDGGRNASRFLRIGISLKYFDEIFKKPKKLFGQSR